jgi:hypothetical protein
MSTRRKETGKRPDAYKDYRKILERDDIDAVMIATPTWHTDRRRSDARGERRLLRKR